MNLKPIYFSNQAENKIEKNPKVLSFRKVKDWVFLASKEWISDREFKITHIEEKSQRKRIKKRMMFIVCVKEFQKYYLVTKIHQEAST